MAFDRNNPADLLALKTEVTTDPLGRGYNIESTTIVLDLLNNPSNNVSGETGPAALNSDVLLKAIFDEPISSQDQFKVDLVFGIGGDLSKFRADLSGLSVGLSNAIAGITRPLNRAEVLFAVNDENGTRENVTITREDWLAARDS